MQERRLKAILFSDIVGYTALMGRDEPEALRVLQINKRVHQECINKYNGKLLKEMGDGMLASFDTVSNAVHCAGEIQNKVASHQNFKLRIGIHEGEVIITHNDIFGDGVNIASRIQSLAHPGHIWISENVYRNIFNKPGIKASFVGEKKLKNVEYPIKIYDTEVDLTNIVKENKIKPIKWTNRRKHGLMGFGAALLVMLVIFGTYQIIKNNFNTSDNNEKSIAVLPFINDSPDDSNQYFCNGIMVGILDQISQVPGLTVVSRSSVERYREDRSSVSRIAEDLKVKYLVEGSVQKIGDEAIIFAQLIDAKKDNKLWSKRYSRNLTNIFAIQAEITQSIAEALHTIISPELKVNLQSIPTSDMVAYDYYLQGVEYLSQARDSRFLTNEEWESNLRTADLFFTKALERDSLLAEALVGKAEIKIRGRFSDEFLDQDFMSGALGLLKQALTINPSLGKAYRLQALCYNMLHKNDLTLKAVEKSIEINPNDINSLYLIARISRFHTFDFARSILSLKEIEKRISEKDDLFDLFQGYVDIFWQIGDMEMMLNYIDKQEVVTPGKYNNRIWYHFATGHYEDFCYMADSIFSNENQTRYINLGQCYLYKGDHQSALPYFEKWEELIEEESADNYYSLVDWHRYGEALVLSGQNNRGMELIQKQININKKQIDVGGRFGSNIFPLYDLAGMHAFIDEKELAYEYLTQMIEEDCWIREGWIAQLIRHDIQFQKLRDDAGFKKILADAETTQSRVQAEVRSLVLD